MVHCDHSEANPAIFLENQIWIQMSGQLQQAYQWNRMHHSKHTDAHLGIVRFRRDIHPSRHSFDGFC